MQQPPISSRLRANPYNLPPLKDRLCETFKAYYKLGFTAFGGPPAHIAILFDEMVIKRQWISDQQFTELLAICQALPGPSSTELAYSISLIRSGFVCSILGFLLWSLPGAIVMTIVGFFIGSINDGIPLWATRLEQGLASAAIGLVALAAYKMSTSLATDKLTRILALIAGSISALYTAPWLLPVMMIASGLVSYVFYSFVAPAYGKRSKKRIHRGEPVENDLEHVLVVNEAGSSGSYGSCDAHKESTADAQKSQVNGDKTSSAHGSADMRIPNDLRDTTRKPFSYSKKLGFVFFLVFLVLLIASVLVKVLVPSSSAANYGPLVATFYFVGSIIFGGGPVIIPLLKTYMVDPGWMTDQQFLVGLALIQSLPGPNFNLACFLGAVAMMNANKNAVAGAILGFVAIFFPGLILKNAIIPFWQFFREHSSVQKVFRGVNACALGLVFSATWLLWLQTNNPGGKDGYHAVIASAAFVASGYLSIPAPIVIIVGGGMGAIEYAAWK
ncbi:hypothetical protein EC973_003727 [Apophysomyces ossiformis]|uniref:Chromate transporter n=1 Tax=Apophysomyces ossiformis TaxID=679940 RepID=A0A8H7BLE3_9FUNG|nr:hypothetical protein EC973_003727 [Apophysomyces ossiformis]